MKFIIFLLSLCTCIIAKADVHLSENYEYYTALASSKIELEHNLKKASPIKKEDGDFAAKANIAINWKMFQLHAKDICKIGQIEVSVDVIYTMPKLESSNQETLSIWDKWYPMLLAHEFGHKDIGLEYARRIEKEVMATKSETTCDKLMKNVTALTDKIIGEYNAAQLKYDAITDYGSSRGADLEKIIADSTDMKIKP